jgi:TatA/E family protein of Tat protein translocase
MGPLGAQEIIAIFLLALLLFGPKKLPELGRMLGKALSEFRRAKSELKTTFESHLRELEREARLEDGSNRNDYSSSRYPYSYDDYGRSDSNYNSSSSSYETSPTHNAGSSETTTTPSGSEQATASQDQPASASEPIAGTVPRSGAQRADPVSAATEEKHSA